MVAYLTFHIFVALTEVTPRAYPPQCLMEPLVFGVGILQNLGDMFLWYHMEGSFQFWSQRFEFLDFGTITAHSSINFFFCLEWCPGVIKEYELLSNESKDFI